MDSEEKNTLSIEDLPAQFPGDEWGERLGMELVEISPDRVVARLEAQSFHQQPYGILHGGVYCSIVEGVASIGAGHAARSTGGKGVVGVSNHTEFLRSHSSGELIAEGTPIHIGRSAHLWGVEIKRSSDGKLVSRGQVRFHVLDQLPGERT